MAVRLNTTGQAVSWQDYNGDLDGLASLSVSLTFTPTATTDARLFGKWNFFAFGHCFSTYLSNTDEIVFIVAGTGGYRARVTTSSPITVNEPNRIVVRWTAAGVMAIAVNGVDCPLATFGGFNDVVTGLNTTVSTLLKIGHQDIASGDISAVGSYAELAVWNVDIGAPAALAVTDTVAPESPVTYTSGLFFYVPMCRNGVGFPFPDPYFKNLINNVDAGTYTLDEFPTGTAEHPFVVYPDPSAYDAGFCDVAHVVEVEPEIAQSFGPLVWVEWGGSDDAIRVWAPVDLPDPSTYYHGYKTPWLLSAGKVVRALSDEQGEYQGQTFDVTVNDTSRDLRTLLGTSDDRRHLLNTRGVMRMISQDDWRAKLVPRTVAIGKLRNYRLH